jgi:hypothetical protein
MPCAFDGSIAGSVAQRHFELLVGAEIRDSRHLGPSPDQADMVSGRALDGDRDVLGQVFEPCHLLKPASRKCLIHNVLSRLDRVVPQLDYPDKFT